MTPPTQASRPRQACGFPGPGRYAPKGSRRHPPHGIWAFQVQSHFPSGLVGGGLFRPGEPGSAWPVVNGARRWTRDPGTWTVRYPRYLHKWPNSPLLSSHTGASSLPSSVLVFIPPATVFRHSSCRRFLAISFLAISWLSFCCHSHLHPRDGQLSVQKRSSRKRRWYFPPTT